MGLQINPGGGGDRCDELIQAGMTRYVDVRSESGYRKLVRECPPPDGYVWKRSPFGSQKGRWKAVVAEEPEIQFTDTGLEQDLRDHLQSWGFWEHFEQDCRELGRQLDFADRENKVALEPGAVYYHTPDGCQGQAVEQVGEHPEEVYSPVTDSDLRKQRTLSSDGWAVLWMTEKGVRQQSKTIKDWLEQFYGRSSP